MSENTEKMDEIPQDSIPNEKEERLQRSDDVILMALCAGRNYTEAANEIGWDRKTVVQRVKTPEFQKKLAERQADAWEQFVNKITDAICPAAAKMKELTESQDPKIAFGAAKELMDQYIKVTSMAEMKKRLEALEEEQKKRLQ